MDSIIVTREREGLYTRQNYLHVYAGTKCRRGVWCGVIAGFYGNVKGHPLYNIRDTLNVQFAVVFTVLACKQVIYIHVLISDCACLTQEVSI